MSKGGAKAALIEIRGLEAPGAELLAKLLTLENGLTPAGFGAEKK